jgi:hypothetical protein
MSDHTILARRGDRAEFISGWRRSPSFNRNTAGCDVIQALVDQDVVTASDVTVYLIVGGKRVQMLVADVLEFL